MTDIQLQVKKVYWTLRTSIRYWWEDWFLRYIMPRIKTPFPPAPHGGHCPQCNNPLKMYAYNVGDGWVFWWDCEDACLGDENLIEDWYPFRWGAWATGDELAKIGIEVV